MRKPKTTNPQLLELISCLKKQSRESKVGIWRDAAERLSKHRRQRIVVNLSCLNRYTEKSETVIVPGKVLASGEISHPITIAAFAFSGKAKEKIMAARGKCLSFAELIKKNPTGSNIRIIG